MTESATAKMPLRPRTVRLQPEALAVIEAAADQVGISTSQFIREAAIVRALIIVGHKDAADAASAIAQAGGQDEVKRLADARPRG